MKLALIASVGLGIAASAAIARPVSMAPVAFNFIDISAIPGANTGLHADDASVAFNALNGNCILPAGTINISSNGTIAVPAQNTFTNAVLSLTSNQGYYPFWDDLRTDNATGNVFAANVGTTTIIQWDQVGTFAGGTGTGTFEVQILNNPSGSGLQAIYTYVDTDFGGTPGSNFGASATIGARAGNPSSEGFVQNSFNAVNSAPSQTSLGVFCSVPTPGAAGLLGLGGLVALRRRR